jgi:phosphoenolpyruvate carboxykinase (ATP)
VPTESDLYRQKLSTLGITQFGEVHWNATTGELYEHAVRRREGTVAHLGPLVVTTGHHTGRSPDDKFIVREPTSEDYIWWPQNEEFSVERFDALRKRLIAYLRGKDLFVQDCYVCAHPKYRLPLRIITETAWHSLFTRNMFLRILDRETLLAHEPEFTVIQTAHFHADKERDGTNSEAFIIINFGARLALIGATSYGGEIKKSIFTILNYLLPFREVLSMHCSANVGRQNNDVALFFGLSGTGKTTLSADPDRRLIGDDEHGWCEDGIFNFEGGCYAKVIGLSQEAEPAIYECTRRFGTILENVAIDRRTRRLDLNDDTLTENTRAAYPVNYMGGIVEDGMADHPKNIVFLCCDAYGVMPPVAKLSPEQAMYHFLSGYTAKVGGTERGKEEPEATFSACFGAPFMARPPEVYAKMLGERLEKHDVNCWLINTGWVGGSFKEAERMPIAFTRAIVRAVLSGALANVKMAGEPVFGLEIPVHCPDVPDKMLMPRDVWSSPEAYDAQAERLVKRFRGNFTEHFEGGEAAEIAKAGP